VRQSPLATGGVTSYLSVGRQHGLGTLKSNEDILHPKPNNMRHRQGQEVIYN